MAVTGAAGGASDGVGVGLAGAAAGVGVTGAAPGGVSGVNDSYIGFLLPDRVVLCERRVDGR